MKWYSTENVQGQENYTIPDAMLKFAKENGVSVRGHTILWDDENFQPEWVKSLSPDKLREAAAKRMNSMVTKYIGQVIAWDEMNENLHCRYFKDKLGENASAIYYSTTYHLDPNTVMFMNEYNTIAYRGENVASPTNYIRKVKEIQRFQEIDGISLAIGVQGHFSNGMPNTAYMRTSVDLLAATRLPIWLTEVGMNPSPEQVYIYSTSKLITK
ncbi:hypothetical protein RYX36_021402 [Vicia faba]